MQDLQRNGTPDYKSDANRYYGGEGGKRRADMALDFLNPAPKRATIASMSDLANSQEELGDATASAHRHGVGGDQEEGRDTKAQPPPPPILSTPTPTQFLFPKNVTEEQEEYAHGFSRALEELYKEKGAPADVAVSSEAETNPPPPTSEVHDRRLSSPLDCRSSSADSSGIDRTMMMVPSRGKVVTNSQTVITSLANSSLSSLNTTPQVINVLQNNDLLLSTQSLPYVSQRSEMSCLNTVVIGDGNRRFDGFGGVATETRTTSRGQPDQWCPSEANVSAIQPRPSVTVGTSVEIHPFERVAQHSQPFVPDQNRSSANVYPTMDVDPSMKIRSSMHFNPSIRMADSTPPNPVRFGTVGPNPTHMLTPLTPCGTSGNWSGDGGTTNRLVDRNPGHHFQSSFLDLLPEKSFNVLPSPPPPPPPPALVNLTLMQSSRQPPEMMMPDHRAGVPWSESNGDGVPGTGVVPWPGNQVSGSGTGLSWPGAIGMSGSGSCSPWSGTGMPAEQDASSRGGMQTWTPLKPVDTSTVVGLAGSFDPEEQDRMKLDRKRAKNRVAAQRCQIRKLERIARLEDKAAALRDQNAKLVATVDNLRRYIAELKQQIIAHADKGCRLMLPDVSSAVATVSFTS